MSQHKEGDMFELAEDVLQNAVIKVIGVGGGGGNAVQHMVENTVEGVEFICANTDAQALRSLSTDTVLQLGASHTKGLGAGANPDVGRQAARDDEERIAGTLKGADMVFITAGMGGGTGTGAAPVVAEIAKEMGILTVAVVTRPFSFEGKKRQVIAEEGIKTLSETVDSLITIPNEKLLEVLGTNSSLMEAFGKANSVLHGAVKGISDLITRPGMINVDFADVRTVMQQQGQAMMGRGSSKGDNRAMEATLEAIGSPYLENIDLKGATGLLVNVTAGPDLSLGEFSTVGAAIGEYADDEATVVVGTVLDPELKDELHVTVVATGLGSKEAKSSSDDAAEKVQTAKKEEAVKRPAEKASAAPAEKRERPAAVKRPSGSSRPRTKTEGDMDYLDVPAFLRRQAD